MRKTQIGLRTLGAVLALAWGGWACKPALAQAKEGAAFDRLSADRLIKQLSLLGMTELLEALEQEVPAEDKSAAALALRGRIRVGLANAMSEPEDRNRLLDEAIPLLRQAIKLVQGDKSKTKQDPPETLELYRWTLELAVAEGWYRVENPHVLRLRYLQGGENDRKVILKYTKEAVDLLDILKEDVADTLTAWRPILPFLMEFVPVLEDLQDQVKYNAAWIRLHRAMALEDGAEKTQLCQDMIAEMRKFVDDEQSGVMYWALYVTGSAYRLMKQHDEAEKFLDKAAVPEADSLDLRQRAWFERARNRIEEGDPQKTEKAIQEFERSASAVLGQDKQVQVDLRVVLLRNYFYELRADAEKDPRKADDLRQKGQQILLSFVEKYADRPAILREYFRMMADKLAHVEDLDKAGALVVMVRAYAKVDSTDENEQAEAEQLLLRVLAHPDLKSEKVARAIQPGVLWELAFLMNKRKRNVDAATYFVALARLYPSHPLAEQSARNAVQSIYAVFRERRDQGSPIGTNLSLEFIRVIDTLFGHWGKDADAAKWHFDLASQCVRLAEATEEATARFYWQSRAIAAFEKVPASLLEYMEAQHSALALRTEVVLARDDLAERLQAGNERTAAALRKLAELLISYEEVAFAANSAGPTTAPAARRPAGAAGAAPAARAGQVDVLARRAGELRKLLDERLKVYADPGELISRQKAYSGEAKKEGGKAAEKARSAEGKEKEELEALAAGLREWAAQADYQAAVIKYEQLPKGKKPQEREAIEKEALGDLRAILSKWPATGVLRAAFEFEIRKLIERGQTQDAIAKVKDFKARYPEQAEQLIKLVVDQIQKRISQLRKALKEAVTGTQFEQNRGALVGYQKAYESFAKDLFEPIKDLPIDLPRLDQKVKDVEALEEKGDFQALLQDANQVAALCGEYRVEPGEIKPKEELDAVVAAAKRPGADTKQILPDLASAFINALSALQADVQERYALHQMYADALVNRGQAEEMQKEAFQAKAAYQTALGLFQNCYDVDEKRRKVQAEWLEARYRPRIEAVKSQAKSMDAVGRLIDEFKKELAAGGEDPARSSDVTTLEVSYEFLGKASNPQEEKERLPRTVNLLLRAWETLLARRQAHVVVDHVGIIGLARSHRGLKQYDKAMEFYRRYTDGIDRAKHAKLYWQAHLERAQCHLEGYRDSPDAMKNLVIQINLLIVNSPDDKTMGGYADEFEAIKREAQKLAEKAATKKPE